MPFGLGFFATAGTGATLGTFDLLETQVLGSSQSSITFSSLGTYASTYKHLQIRATMRKSDTDTSFQMRLNGDAGSNYSAHGLYGTGSSVLSLYDASTSGIYGYPITQSSAPANAFSGVVFDFLDPFQTTKFKTIRWFVGRSNEVQLYSGSWRSTSSVTSWELKTNAGSFVTGSRFSLYGIKGA